MPDVEDQLKQLSTQILSDERELAEKLDSLQNRVRELGVQLQELQAEKQRFQAQEGLLQQRDEEFQAQNKELQRRNDELQAEKQQLRAQKSNVDQQLVDIQAQNQELQQRDDEFQAQVQQLQEFKTQLQERYELLQAEKSDVEKQLQQQLQAQNEEFQDARRQLQAQNEGFQKQGERLRGLDQALQERNIWLQNKDKLIKDQNTYIAQLQQRERELREHDQGLQQELQEQDQELQAQYEEFQAQNDQLRDAYQQREGELQRLQAQNEDLLVQDRRFQDQGERLRGLDQALQEQGRRLQKHKEHIASQNNYIYQLENKLYEHELQAPAATARRRSSLATPARRSPSVTTGRRSRLTAPQLSVTSAAPSEQDNIIYILDPFNHKLRLFKAQSEDQVAPIIERLKRAKSMILATERGEDIGLFESRKVATQQAIEQTGYKNLTTANTLVLSQEATKKLETYAKQQSAMDAGGEQDANQLIENLIDDDINMALGALSASVSASASASAAADTAASVSATAATTKLTRLASYDPSSGAIKYNDAKNIRFEASGAPFAPNMAQGSIEIDNNGDTRILNKSGDEVTNTQAKAQIIINVLYSVAFANRCSVATDRRASDKNQILNDSKKFIYNIINPITEQKIENIFTYFFKKENGEFAISTDSLNSILKDINQEVLDGIVNKYSAAGLSDHDFEDDLDSIESEELDSSSDTESPSTSPSSSRRDSIFTSAKTRGGGWGPQYPS
ncbi:hypothetical protein N9O56_00305 [Rickettsiales bacterium]|nr:hypothetical protein [Rickettsiales bacterium]